MHVFILRFKKIFFFYPYDRMKSKHSCRVKVITRQGHLAVLDRHILPGTHVYDLTLLFPFQNSSCKDKINRIKFYNGIKEIFTLIYMYVFTKANISMF